MTRSILTMCICCIFPLGDAFAQDAPPAGDAAALYLQAAKLVAENDADNVMCPAASNEVFRGYPPYEPKWIELEKAAYAFNVEARALAHRARSISDAKWPAMNVPNPVRYLNDCRNLSNDLADAAVYQASQGDNAAAIETIRDQLHLSDMMKTQADKKLIVLLVSDGIRADAMDRLNIITSAAILTRDPKDEKDVQITVARELLAQLIGHPDGKTEMVAAAEHDAAPGKPLETSIEKLIETNRLDYAECDLAAMSLACHLYRFDTGKWPTSLADVHEFLPNLPIDPWGDGKQTLGYVLVKGGLPDGSDRPLVYCRREMKDGLFFRRDEPEYSYYGGDGSKLPLKKQKHGGQFRDVAGWAPPDGFHPQPTTQALE